MRRPLVIVALLYVGGILLADGLPFQLPILLTCSVLLAFAALGWKRARPHLLAPLLGLAGAANLTLHTAIISPHDLRVLIGEKSELVTVRGALPETPYHRVYEHEETETWRTLAQLEVRAIRQRGGDWQPAFGRVAVSTPGMLPANFFAGAQVEISGVLRPPKAPAVEGAFDYRTYLKWQGIYYQLRVPSTNHWQIISDSAASTQPPLADRFCAWAKRTLALGLPVEDEPLRLLWTMTLGWKTGLTGEVALPFMRSGTMHIFAISGLHIALIAGILVSLLRVLQVPRGVCGVIVIPLIWFYTAVTGWQASAVRSTVMMTVIIVGWSLKRPSDLLNSLAAAAFIILLWEPQQLFQASFQLSFFVVLSLALFTPVFQSVWRGWLQPDPFLPDELRPRWQRWLTRPLRWTAAGLATSLAAWVGSIPLIAYYFHLFTPVSLLANLVVVPLSGLALTSNLASLVVGGWFPACAELFNHSAWFWMLLMIRISEWAAQLPGGCFHVGSPPAVAFVFYYAMLICFLAGWLHKPKVRPWVIAGLVILGSLWLVQWQRERSVTRLTVIPLSGGSAIYFDAPGRSDDVLIDCGNRSAAEFTLTPFLRARGVNRLGRLLLTHGDANQVGGAQFVAERFSPRLIATNSLRFRSPVYREVVEELSRSQKRWLELHRGDRLGRWSVLHPEPTDHFDRADDGTLVLLGEFHGTRVLLLSDLGWSGQKLLLERNPDLRADIVIAGLPTEGEPLSDVLLEAIKPRLIVVADSEFPATRRVSPQLRQRLSERSVKVICTREVGSVTLSFRKGKWRMQTALGAEPASRGEKAAFLGTP